jgi:cellobiose phosphorylase
MDRLYSFINDGRSVIIHTPVTPRAWINYLWNEDGYLSSVSQNGKGTSRYLTDEMQLEVMNEEPNRFVYLRDDESNVCWNPGFAPLHTELDAYECEHTLSFTEIRSSKSEITTAVRYFVPMKGLQEVWKVTVKNESLISRKISVFPVVDIDLAGEFPQPRYYNNGILTTMHYSEELNGIYAYTSNPYVPHNKYKGFLSSSEKVSGYDCSSTDFLGGDISFSHPLTLLKGRDCTNSENVTVGRTAILQNKIVLKPGESKEITYCLGFCSSLEDAVATISEVFKKDYLEKSLEETEAYWDKVLNYCWIETPDQKVNNLMNIWVKKQMIFCKVGKKGVRDNMQIADGVMQIWPEGGRAEVLEVLSHQFKDGHTVLTWFPYDDTYYSDQPIWLVMGVTGYIKETGDFGILSEIVPYQDGGEGTVWEHLKAGLCLKETDLGANGLCKLRFADWNDALNVYTDENAESVFVTMGLGYMLKELADLAERIGEKDFAAHCKKRHKEVMKRVNEIAWTGEYYSMVMHKDGVIGGPDSEGSKIYINPQTWGILGEMIPEERMPLVLKSMDEKIEHEFGLPINWPPYGEHNYTIGRMGAFPYGVFENGGAYCHATGFGIVANAKVGRGDTALRLLKKIMPDSEYNPSSNSGAEPFVFTNCYFTNPKKYGWSYASWMTGTSVWCFKGLVEGILGVQRGYDGLIIDPSMPSNWNGAKIIRRYRGAIYSIQIRNPKGLEKGRVSIVVDGKPIHSNILPIFHDENIHDIEVTIL